MKCARTGLLIDECIVDPVEDSHCGFHGCCQSYCTIVDEIMGGQSGTTH